MAWGTKRGRGPRGCTIEDQGPPGPQSKIERKRTGPRAPGRKLEYAKVDAGLTRIKRKYEIHSYAVSLCNGSRTWVSLGNQHIARELHSGANLYS